LDIFNFLVVSSLEIDDDEDEDDGDDVELKNNE
jgi:hypothetical protein